MALGSVAAALVLRVSAPVLAQDAAPLAAESALPGLFPPAVSNSLSFETFAGSHMLESSRYHYAGLVLHGAQRIYQPGFRLKLMGGYGGYAYLKGTEPIAARLTGGEILVGYQGVWGPLTLKLYAGGQFERHALSPLDPGNSLSGTNWGARAALEGWLNLGTDGFVSADAALSSLKRGYSAAARIGYKFLGPWAAGPEAGVMGNQTYHKISFGAFVRGPAWGYEGRISGGIARDYDKDGSLYLAVSLGRKF